MVWTCRTPSWDTWITSNEWTESSKNPLYIGVFPCVFKHLSVKFVASGTFRNLLTSHKCARKIVRSPFGCVSTWFLLFPMQYFVYVKAVLSSSIDLDFKTIDVNRCMWLRNVDGRGSVSKFHSICQGYVFTRVRIVGLSAGLQKKTTEAISKKLGHWIGLSQDWILFSFLKCLISPVLIHGSWWK